MELKLLIDFTETAYFALNKSHLKLLIKAGVLQMQN